MMVCGLRFSIGVLAFGLFAAACPAQDSPSREALATVVVYNRADPSSEKLARFYADRRKIPADRVVGLDCPVKEEISRVEYNGTIALPLRDIFLKKGWWLAAGEKKDGAARIIQSNIRFVALIRGMPLKIQADATIPADPDLPKDIGARNEASVDSELACLGLGPYKLAGPALNPYFRRYTRILDWRSDPGLLLVCRLDAVSETAVFAMIDDGLLAERDGLWGWAYVDARNIQSGGYAEGDGWLRKAAEEMRKNGIPVLFDDVEATLPKGFPVTDAAVYYGWYASELGGPFAEPGFRFRPGAIAVHIHSFSAATLRNPLANWCGPLVGRGAAATLGNVYEPYLTLTPNIDIFQDRLMEGFTLAESAYMSNRCLSWMTVVIGDPLYRPYARWNNLFQAAEDDLTSWERYRQIVRAHDGKVTNAAPELLAAAQKTGKSMFLEALAAAQMADGQKAEALKSLDEALGIEKDPRIRFRLVLEKILLLRSQGESGKALAVLREWQPKTPGPSQAALLQEILDQMQPPPPPPPAK